MFKDVAADPNVTFTYYEGKWSRLPDFDKLEAKAKGQAVGFDLDVAKRKNDHALRFEGLLDLEWQRRTA